MPEPLGVTYGKRIGVGGFGAVYEGTWTGKQVAVKVRGAGWLDVQLLHVARCWWDALAGRWLCQCGLGLICCWSDVERSCTLLAGRGGDAALPW